MTLETSVITSPMSPPALVELNECTMQSITEEFFISFFMKKMIKREFNKYGFDYMKKNILAKSNN